MARAGLDKDPREIAAMFDGVARRYDLANTVLAFGLDRRWREAARRAVNPARAERILDLAAGTAVSTVEYHRDSTWCVAADFSRGMLRQGRRAGREVPMVAADALALPFRADSFDAVTISFGLRNLADTAAGLREMARVTRPGGRLVVCEFSTPTFEPLRTVYRSYLPRALPVVADRVASNPEAYRYLAESIRTWPDQPELARVLAESGWSGVSWRNLTGGIVALHHAVKPRS